MKQKSDQKISVLIDTSPLGNANAVRGVGMYTRLLVEFLKKVPQQINVFSSTVEVDKQHQPDIIHYPFFDLFFLTLPFFHAKPTIVTVHDVIPLIFPKYYPAGAKGMIKFFKQKVALKRVDGIITDSLASKTDIMKHLSVSEDKIYVVPLAANPYLSLQDEKNIRRVRREYHLPANFVLYVGDINYNKNLPQLIKAVRFLPANVKLVCVGKSFYPHDIPEWQWLETQMALSDVKDRVKFLTNVNTDDLNDLAAIYSAAVAYIQPSLYEGFGLPVLEAMACKTPVICTQNSSLVEVAGDRAVFVDTDAASLAQGVMDVLSWSKTKRQEKVRSAYKWSQNFSWDRVAKQTLEVYQTVLTKKSKITK